MPYSQRVEDRLRSKPSAEEHEVRPPSRRTPRSAVADRFDVCTSTIHAMLKRGDVTTRPVGTNQWGEPIEPCRATPSTNYLMQHMSAKPRPRHSRREPGEVQRSSSPMWRIIGGLEESQASSRLRRYHVPPQIKMAIGKREVVERHIGETRIVDCITELLSCVEIR
jgi:hypothetical protein